MSDRRPTEPAAPALATAHASARTDSTSGPATVRRTRTIKPRPSLSRSQIVAAAIGLARADGVAAASMRRIGEELGSSPMALYRHFTDRRQLLLAMLDEVAAAIRLPAPDQDPRAELTAIMNAAHHAFRCDPWVVEVLVVDGLASPQILPMVERMFTAFERAGLAGPDIAAGYALLWHYVYGESISSQHDRPDTFARRMTRDAIAAYPAIGRVAATLPPTGQRDYFAQNLARLIDSLLTPPATGAPSA